jgi:hypothetical protein
VLEVLCDDGYIYLFREKKQEYGSAYCPQKFVSTERKESFEPRRGMRKGWKVSNFVGLNYEKEIGKVCAINMPDDYIIGQNELLGVKNLILAGTHEELLVE